MLHARRVAGEAARAALNARASSTVVAVIVGVCMLAIVHTTGQSAAAERRVLDRVDEAGSRAITIERDGSAPPLPAHAVAVLGRLSEVEWAIGVSSAVDGRNTALGGGGHPAGFRTVVGALPSQVRLAPRSAVAGEALVPAALAERLGMRDRAGSVELTDGRQVAVVGVFDADGALAFLTETGIILAGTAEPDVQRIHLLARDTDVVDQVAATARAVIAPARPGDVRIATADALTELRRLLEGDLGTFGRDLLAAVLAIVALLISATTTAQTVLRRRDIGRRRALGATRMTVVALIVVQSALPAALGSVLALAAAPLVTRLAGSALPPPGFLAGAATLTVLVAALAAVPPAVAAARRDPLAVLRTP